MVPYAALKVFEPLEAFGAEERAYWHAYVSSTPTPPPPRAVLLSRERGIGGSIATLTTQREHADVLIADGRPFVCPHRTRLRLLASVVAFHRSIPAEVVAAFMPEGEAERAVDELERLRAEHPDWRSSILVATWEVPLRWFAAFDGDEREVADGTIRYRTGMAKARARAARGVTVLRQAMPGSGVVDLVADLARWLGQFHEESLVAMDYGEVGRLLGTQALFGDHSARDVQESLNALAAGDGERASGFYMSVAERWATVRARESSN